MKSGKLGYVQHLAHLSSVADSSVSCRHTFKPKCGFKVQDDATRAQGCLGVKDLDVCSKEDFAFPCDHLPCLNTLIDILQKCRKTQNRVFAIRTLLYACNHGLEALEVIGNHLVPVLVDCGCIKEAQLVFCRLAYCNEYSWTSLIQGYSKCGDAHHALDMYQKMQEDKVHPSGHTFIVLLTVCAKLKLAERGQELHSMIAQDGLETDLCIGSALVDMYAKCGLLPEAQDICSELPVRDVITWTALIAGYIDYGYSEDAFMCLKQMQVDGLCLDAGTFVCCLNGCSNKESLGRGQEMHAEIAKDGLEGNLIVGNSLVDMYMKSGLLLEAHFVFDEMQERDVVSWTTLISGFAEHGCITEALAFFEGMERHGVPSNDVTLVCCLRVCSGVDYIRKGQEIHGLIVNRGIEGGPFIAAALVDMYGKCQLFDEAFGVLYKLEDKDAVPWNALIAGYADHELVEEAMKAFEMMHLAGISPDHVTFVCILKACCSVEVIDKLRELHRDIIKVGFENELAVGNTLVDMYVKYGSLAEAQNVFDGLQVRDIVSWTALIGGYAFQGKGECVFGLLERMKAQHIEPDGIALLSVLSLCSHAGLMEKGHECLEALSMNYGVALSIGHLNAVVDLLGRAGQLKQAVIMLEKMPFQPDLITWLSVLGACQKWGDVELAEKAFDHVMKIDEGQEAAFVLMSNTYLDAHMWEDARKIGRMQDRIKGQ